MVWRLLKNEIVARVKVGSNGEQLGVRKTTFLGLLL